MGTYREILKESKKIDQLFQKINEKDLEKIQIKFKIPKNHPRSKKLKKYTFSPISLEELPNQKIFLKTPKHIFITDKAVSQIGFVKKFFTENNIKPTILESIENKTKTLKFAEELIKEKGWNQLEDTTLVVLGGGLLLNVVSFIAEKTSANVIQFPTTVLSMADSAGGKVRMNLVEKERSYKHFYKSFYEPNAMFFEERFLESIPENQIKIGLVEIIKHGIFQSKPLYKFLRESGKSIFTDGIKLKKAILWAVSLKKVCLEVDIEENENGSRRILRGGHDFSDRLEEDEELRIPHGFAVAIGIIKQLELERNEDLLNKTKTLFRILEIPTTLEEIRKHKIGEANN